MDAERDQISPSAGGRCQTSTSSRTAWRVLPSGDCVVVEYTGRGTHTGPLVTAAGTLPAPGRSVTLHLCDIYDFSDGKIQTQRCYVDSGSLLAQLGVTAGQAATSR